MEILRLLKFESSMYFDFDACVSVGMHMRSSSQFWPDSVHPPKSFLYAYFVSRTQCTRSEKKQ